MRGSENRSDRISVVVPVYRNAGTLLELHGRLVGALEPEAGSLELIFVNDACPAGSASVLSRMASLDARIRVVTHERNQGQRRAAWHGLQAATGDVIVIMDADLQDLPEDVPSLLHEVCDGGFGAVFACRRGEHQARLRMVTSRVFKRLLSALAGVPPGAGTFLAMTREARDRILPIDAGSPCLPVLMAAAGVKMGSLQVKRGWRITGESAYSEWMRVRLAWSDLRTAWRLRQK